MLDVAIHRSYGAAVAEGETVCRFRGELMSKEAPVVRALRGRLAHAKTVLVDLRGVDAYDRPGLGALLGVLRGAHPDTGRVRVCVDQPALLKLLRAEGLDRLYQLVEDPGSLQRTAVRP